MVSQIYVRNKSRDYETKLRTASTVTLLLEIVDVVTCFLLPINTSISGQIFSLALIKT